MGEVTILNIRHAKALFLPSDVRGPHRTTPQSFVSGLGLRHYARHGGGLNLGTGGELHYLSAAPSLQQFQQADGQSSQTLFY
jgi:hypothetical protein